MIFPSIEKLWDVSVGCDFLVFLSAKDSFYQCISSIKLATFLFLRSFWFFVWFFKIFPCFGITLPLWDLELVWYFLVHLIAWKLSQGSPEICVLFHLIFEVIFPRNSSCLSFDFIFESLALFFFLFDHGESVIFVYMVFSSNCLKLANNEI